MFNKQTFRTAIKEINAMSPDAVVVTGDLTESGVQSQLKQAAKEFKQVKAKNIIYVSGNHDYRATGYLLFKGCFPFNQITETKKILKEEWVNKRYSYKLIQGYESKNDRNQKFTSPTKENGVRRQAS